MLAQSPRHAASEISRSTTCGRRKSRTAGCPVYTDHIRAETPCASRHCAREGFVSTSVAIFVTSPLRIRFRKCWLMVRVYARLHKRLPPWQRISSLTLLPNFNPQGRSKASQAPLLQPPSFHAFVISLHVCLKNEGPVEDTSRSKFVKRRPYSSLLNKSPSVCLCLALRLASRGVSSITCSAFGCPTRSRAF